VEPGVGNVEPTVRKMEHVRVGDDTELLTYRDLDLQGRFQGLVQVASYEAVVGIREEVLRDIGDPHRRNKADPERSGLQKRYFQLGGQPERLPEGMGGSVQVAIQAVKVAVDEAQSRFPGPQYVHPVVFPPAQ